MLVASISLLVVRIKQKLLLVLDNSFPAMSTTSIDTRSSLLLLI